MIREGSKNLFRLGMFEPILNSLHPDREREGAPPLYKRVVAGMASGTIGAYTCNPLDLVKSRMQNQSLASASNRHNYKGPVDAMVRLVREEGVQGAWRGCHIGAVRSSVNTAANLATYTALKDLAKDEYGVKESVGLHMACSISAAFTGVLIGNPLDVPRPRLYNQPAGEARLYTGAPDAFVKIMRREGAGAFYKGFVPHFMRVGPHFVLTFIMLEQLRTFLREQNRRGGLPAALKPIAEAQCEEAAPGGTARRA